MLGKQFNLSTSHFSLLENEAVVRTSYMRSFTYPFIQLLQADCVPAIMLGNAALNDKHLLQQGNR